MWVTCVGALSPTHSSITHGALQRVSVHSALHSKSASRTVHRSTPQCMWLHHPQSQRVVVGWAPAEWRQHQLASHTHTHTHTHTHNTVQHSTTHIRTDHNMSTYNTSSASRHSPRSTTWLRAASLTHVNSATTITDSILTTTAIQYVHLQWNISIKSD